MKVYTTELIDGVVTLTTHKSMKSFTANNKWCDPKFINVAPSSMLGVYEFANEIVSQKVGIVYSPEQIESQLMLRDLFLNLNH